MVSELLLEKKLKKHICQRVLQFIVFTAGQILKDHFSKENPQAEQADAAAEVSRHGEVRVAAEGAED